MRAELVAGAQVVARTADILKLVSQRSGSGHLVRDLVHRSGITRPTVYRLLSALQACGLVEQDPSSRRWHLGPEAYVLGTLAADRYSIKRLAHNALIRIADATGESSFLSVRRGSESVCLTREEGSYPIRTHVLQPGDRLPLGVGSAGAAILAALTDAEITGLIMSRTQYEPRFSRYSAATIKDSLVETRKLGYAVNRGLLLPGSWGVAAAVRDGSGNPVAALSITAIESRLQGDRLQEVGSLLRREALELEARITSGLLEAGQRGVA